MSKPVKYKTMLDGGPWHGQSLYLTPWLGGTLTFTVRGITGRYNSSGRWISAE